MLYLIGFCIILVAVFFISGSQSKSRNEKQLLEVKKRWGKVKKEYANTALTGLYYQYSQQVSFHQLSQQTLSDIDFEAVFNFVNRTTSKVGEQFLYNRVQQPLNDINALQEIDKQADFFATNTQAREATQLLLLQLNTYDAYFIPTLFQQQIIIKPWWAKWLNLNIAVVLVMLLLSPFFKVLLVWLMLPLSINMFLHYYNRNGSYRYIRSLPQLHLLINIAKQLCKQDIPFDKSDSLKSIASMQPFQRSFKLFNFGQGKKAEDIAQALLLVVDLIKAFFLIEVKAFYKLADELQNKQTEVQQLFEMVGGVDVAISIASLRHGDLPVCKPVFAEEKNQLIATAVYHPLINNCTTNTININQKGILITGSNMSGKTSFLRTIAINSILAQSIYTCFAEDFITPILKLHSSIRIDDNLLEGKSYYFEEVSVMHHLINESGNGFKNLFILDEVFKGTNTVERIAAAKAILSYLAKNKNIVMVATHDIELSQLLLHEYDLYHFTEDIENDNLIFDHLLKEGALKTRNAIKILELSKYPEEIINEAKQLSVKL